MELIFRVEKRGRSLLVKLEEKGSKRILYLDTLKNLAKPVDEEALSLLVRLHLQTNRSRETLSFQRIEVPPIHVEEALRLMRKTGRMVGDVEEVVQKPLQVFPRLVLKDASGCFANLWMDYGIAQILFDDFAPTVKGHARFKKEEVMAEKDLLEAGYLRKPVGDSQYYCPSDKVKEALQLLLGVGWQIQDPFGKQLSKEIEVREEGGRIVIRSSSRAMIDQKVQMCGVWEGDALYVKRSQVGAILPLLVDKDVNWEENLQRLAIGLKNGAEQEKAEPTDLFKGTLLPYQQKGVDWLHFLYRWGFSGLLADEMGLGKTVQVLAFISRLRTNLPVLIVAPTTLLFNWRAEIRKFLPERDNFILISYTTLRLNEEHYAKMEFELIVLDESNAIKTVGTQTARAACKLKGKMKICLSGTPMENRLDEIWSQFHFLLPDLIERSAESLKGQIRPFILRRRKEEVQLDLPEKFEQIGWVEMGEAQKELYDSYKRGVKLDGATQMEILEAILRLRQIAADPRLVGSEEIGAKIEQLILDVKEGLEAGRKILIYSQFTSMLQLIRKEFEGALYLDGSTSGEKRGELVERFQQDPEAKLFLLSLKAGGVGLNLTAADTVFLFDPWWNDAVERQAIDRCHRIGQKKSVFAKRYITVGTIEEKMLQLKAKKQETADQLLDFEGWQAEELLLLLS
jgi:superfamily II DNA or RNA helicase